MALRFNHPFMEGLKDVPEGKKKDLQKIKSWMSTQAHLPPVSDEYVYLFLHACYYSHEKTKSAIDSYFTIRANHPAIFADRDARSPRMQTVLDMGVAKHSKSTSTIAYRSLSNGRTDHASRSLPVGDVLKRPNSSLNSRMTSRDLKSPCGNSNHVEIVPRQYIRQSSNFYMHPEKLKQIIKEREGQTLCNYYDSDVYKVKAVDVVQEQSRFINEAPPENVDDVVVTYEHMLNCAQPRYKQKIIVVQKREEEDTQEKVKKPSITNLWRRRNEATAKEERSAQSRNGKKEEAAKDTRKRYRKRTTILPLYLKKIRENQVMKEAMIRNGTFDKKTNQFSERDERHHETELASAKKPFQIIKAEYSSYNQQMAQNAKALLRQKVMNVDYENEVVNVNRFKLKSKYAEGREENRHWHQNLNTIVKSDGGREFQEGKLGE